MPVSPQSRHVMTASYNTAFESANAYASAASFYVRQGASEHILSREIPVPMSKPPLLLLHAALGAASQLAPLGRALASDFDVVTHDFDGHGVRVPSDAPLSFTGMADDVLAMLDRRGIDSIPIFGHSMGGYVGFCLALHAPQRVQSLHSLGTYFEWDEASAARTLRDLDADLIEQKVPAFAGVLAERHAVPGWRAVVQRTYALIEAVGVAPPLRLAQLRELQTPVRVGVGDRDNLTSVASMVTLTEALANGELIVFPRTGHAIERAPIDVIARSITDFAASAQHPSET